MPKKERFRHAQFGRASSSVLLSELPVLSWTAAEAANLFMPVFCRCFFAVANDSTTNAWVVQAAFSFTRLFRAQTPWGWKGASIRGWVGVGGFATPYSSQRRQRAAGVKDACKLAR
jgi:hypothetical protein